MNGNNLTRHILLMVAAVGLLLSCAGAGERARMAALLEKVEQMDQDYLPLDTVTFMEEVLDFYMGTTTLLGSLFLTTPVGVGWFTASIAIGAGVGSFSYAYNLR